MWPAKLVGPRMGQQPQGFGVGAAEWGACLLAHKVRMHALAPPAGVWYKQLVTTQPHYFAEQGLDNSKERDIYKHLDPGKPKVPVTVIS